MTELLNRLGIQNRLQLVIAACVISLIVITTLGGSGGATPVFFIYRSLLLVVTILCFFACRKEELRIASSLLGAVYAAFALMLVSMLRIPGSHFEGFYLWYKHAFFIGAFLALAWYSRSQTFRWKATILYAVVALNVAHIIPDLVRYNQPFAGFSTNNVNYFGTFLLTGLAATMSLAVFGSSGRVRLTAGCLAALIFFAITQTWSRGATLAAGLMLVTCAVRTGSRIPRRVWVLTAVLALFVVAVASPYMMVKFLDLGRHDPYNYARTDVWRGALLVISENPLLGVGLGQYVNASKRFTFPVNADVVARYLKRAQMAHSEYLHRLAETGIPATVLLLSVLVCVLYLAWKRAKTVPPEHRIFHEAAILTAVGVGSHALVDNCWTIPVTAASLTVIALADILPLERRRSILQLRQLQFAAAGLLVMVWGHSVLIPAAGFYYNDKGHAAYDRFDYPNAERWHLKAIRIVPDHPLFLDNLGMVYFQQYLDRKQPQLLEPAKKYFAAAIAERPQSLDSYIHMETLLIRTLNGDAVHDAPIYKDLIANNTQFTEIDPFIPFVRKNLASAFYQLGRREEAFEILQQAIAYEPNYVPGYLQLSSWYRDMGNAAVSREYEQKAVAVVLKYREFKPREPYEGILLGRPEESFIPKDLTRKPTS
jgi:O-antigen ligase